MPRPGRINQDLAQAPRTACPRPSSPRSPRRNRGPERTARLSAESQQAAEEVSSHRAREVQDGLQTSCPAGQRSWRPGTGTAALLFGYANAPPARAKGELASAAARSEKRAPPAHRTTDRASLSRQMNRRGGISRAVDQTRPDRADARRHLRSTSSEPLQRNSPSSLCFARKREKKWRECASSPPAETRGFFGQVSGLADRPAR